MRPVVRLKPRLSVSCAVAVVLCMTGCSMSAMTAASTPPTHLQRAKVFLAAGDYRRAVEAFKRGKRERREPPRQPIRRRSPIHYGDD